MTPLYLALVDSFTLRLNVHEPLRQRNVMNYDMDRLNKEEAKRYVCSKTFISNKSLSKSIKLLFARLNIFSNHHIHIPPLIPQKQIYFITFISILKIIDFLKAIWYFMRLSCILCK